MTTINLGKVRLNWLGTYAGGTTYEINDAVFYQGDSYVAVAQTTGNAPFASGAVHASWNAVSRGTASVATTRGDIVYRGASGLERLPAGRAGQVLTTNGSNADPYWSDRIGRPNQVVYTGDNPQLTGNGTTTATKYAQQFANCARSGMQVSPSGVNPGWGPSFMITADRRAIKSWGYQAYWALGNSHHSDQYAASPYDGDRSSTAQYCQFNYPLDDDEYFSYVTRTSSSCWVVTSKGRLYGSGYNGYGQLGDGTTTDRYMFTRSPFFGPGTGRTLKDFQMGRSFGSSNGVTLTSFALTEEGELYGVGYNAHGCLGQNNTTNMSTWVQIGAATLNAGGATVMGYQFSGKCSTSNAYIMAWNSNGEYYGWGNINNYQLGFITNPTTQRNEPQRMTELEAAVPSIASTYPKDIMMYLGGNDNDRHINIILFANGTMVVSGTANQGQAGIGGADYQNVTGWQPIVAPSGKTWDRLWGAGAFHSTYYGRTTDNYLYAWGHNNYGQIGDNTSTARATPTLCSGLPAGMQGNIQEVYTWGCNDTGTSYQTTWVKSFSGGKSRWCSFGSTYHGTIGQASIYVPSKWTTARYPTEMGWELPDFGEGIRTIHVQWLTGQYNAIHIVYNDGRIFHMGYDNNQKFTGTHDGSNYMSATFYPRQVIYI